METVSTVSNLLNVVVDVPQQILDNVISGAQNLNVPGIDLTDLSGDVVDSVKVANTVEVVDAI